MATRIWKYPLSVVFGAEVVWQPIKLAHNTHIVSTRAGYGQVVYLWALVDAKEVRTTVRHFAVVGTGRPLPDNIKFIGTVELSDDSIAHVIERI